jgi:hypothetical protein
MLKKLYELGIQEFEKRKKENSNKSIQYFKDKNIEDYVIAGIIFLDIIIQFQ